MSNYPAGAEHDRFAPYNETQAKEQYLILESTVWHDETEHKVLVKCNWQEIEGQKVVTAMKYNYIGEIPKTQPTDSDFDLCEAIKNELGANTTFDF